MSVPYYLKIGRASELKNPIERRIFRALEIIPGVLSFSTLFIIILLSWLAPTWAALFIIPFVIYWLFRTFYFSFHLSASYRKMKEHKKRDWIKELKELPGSNWQDIYHLIIIPRYKEPLEIIEEVFNSLLESDYPKDKMMVNIS